jgi:two-component system response regulator RegX3
LVEDEEALAESIRYSLDREGYAVTVATDGRRAIDRFHEVDPELVILDLMLPEVSGLDVVRMIRQGSTVPIIIVTAKDSEADKVTGLELGADDYVTKPFSVRELISRVRALLRRARLASGTATDDVLVGGPVQMNIDRHEVLVSGASVAFPPKEFELLETFLRAPGRLLTRELLIQRIWGDDYVGDIHVKRVRQKIERDPHEPAHLLTVRGLGYKFVG